MFNAARRVAKNTFFLMMGSVFGKMIRIVFVAYAARYLGAEGFGLYSVVLTLVYLFSVIADFGFNNLIIRDVSRHEEKAGEYLSNSVLLSTFLGILAYSLVILTAYVLHYPTSTIFLLLIAGLTLVPGAVSGSLRAILHAFERMDLAALITLGFDFLNSILGILILYFGFGIKGLFWLLAVNSFLYFFALFILVYFRFTSFTLKFNPKFAWYLLKNAFPYATLAILGILHFKVDIIMLSILKNNEAVGWYSAAYRILEATLFIPSSVAGAVFPVMSRLHIVSKNQLAFAYQKLFKFMLLISLPIAVGGFFLSPSIISILYGSDFRLSTITLKILIWVVPISFINYLLGTVVYTSDKLSLGVFVGFTNTSVNIIGNLILIPMLAHNGAALATLISESITVVMLVFIVSSSLDSKYEVFKFEAFAKPFLAVGILGLYIFFLKDAVWLTIFSAPLLYSFLLYVLKVLGKEDGEIFKAVIQRSR